VLRKDIVDIRASSVSMMPENFEENLKKQDIADILSIYEAGSEVIPTFMSRNRFKIAGSTPAPATIMAAYCGVDFGGPRKRRACRYSNHSRSGGIG
jgi:hypothetical protein